MLIHGKLLKCENWPEHKLLSGWSLAKHKFGPKLVRTNYQLVYTILQIKTKVNTPPEFIVVG